MESQNGRIWLESEATISRDVMLVESSSQVPKKCSVQTAATVSGIAATPPSVNTTLGWPDLAKTFVDPLRIFAETISHKYAGRWRSLSPKTCHRTVYHFKISRYVSRGIVCCPMAHSLYHAAVYFYLSKQPILAKFFDLPGMITI